MKFDVVIANAILHPDIIMYPTKGHKITFMRVLFVPAMEIRSGAGAYAGLAMSRLGLRCCYVDKLGSDMFGRFTRDELEHHGLDMRHVNFYPGSSSFCVSIVQNGEGGTIICYLPPERLSISFNEMSSMFRKAPDGKIIYMFTWFWSWLFPKLKGTPTHKIIRHAKKRGFSIVLDVNYKPKENPSKCEIRELKKSLKYVDVLLPNLRDAEIIIGRKPLAETAHSLLQLGPKIVGLKASDKGSYFASKEESGYIPPFKVRVLDTTGAGDIFGGAFTYGWLKGWKPKKIATFANAASAFGISHEEKNKYPTLRQIQEFLRKAKR